MSTLKPFPESPPALVSAVVCTRNRPGPAATVVRSLLAGEGAGVELILVDQTDGDETRAALSAFESDARFRYHRSERRGKGAALNEGVALARGSVVVCTDDDCHAPPGWISGMARALESQPNAALVFCRVDPVPHDRTAGYVPAYELEEDRLLTSMRDICGGLGIGAGMAVRRDFMLEIGGFDETFGPGAPFPSADDWDIAMRALMKGRYVFETFRLAIVHDGFRTFEQGRAHARRDWFALGAVCAKPLRAGKLEGVVVPLWLFSSRALWPPLSDLLRMRPPRGVGRITAFAEGFAKGLARSVEPGTLRFR